MHPPIVKPLVLAAALAALAAPAAQAQATVKHAPSDAAASAGVPDAVRTYLKHNSGMQFPYEGPEIRLGRAVEGAGEDWLQVPDYPQYSWKNLAGQLVVIDSQTRKVVAIY